MIRLPAIICALALCCLTTRAAEYFVATNGSDSATGADWGNALRTISNAVAKATTAGDTITVSNGTYNVVTQINLTVAAVTVRSFGGGVYGGLGNASSTVVRVVGGTGNRRCFNITTDSTVDGFTARGALRASGTMLGGGFYMTNNPTVQNCIAYENTGDTMYGCGAYLHGGRLLNSLIYSNGVVDRVTGGGLYINGSSAIASNCTIRNNSTGTANGGGSGVFIAAGLMTHSRIISNFTIGTAINGIGIIMSGGAVRNCLVTGNHAQGQVALSDSASGGGVCVLGGVLENSTVIGNTVKGVLSKGAGVYRVTAGVVTNCIIWDNYCTISERLDNHNGLTSANTFWSLTTPALGGNNLSGLQRFQDAASLDYRLMPGPAMDAGTNLAWMTGATDILGNPRTNGAGNRADMGAYEYVPGPLQCGLSANTNDILAPAQVVFTAYTGGTNTTITGYAWDFGDGNTASGAGARVVTNTYASAGAYTVALSVTNSAGETCNRTNANMVTVWGTTAYAWTNSPAPAAPYATWATAARTIGAATFVCPGGVTVIATNGTYVERGTLFIDRAITVRSFMGGLTGATNTVIKGLSTSLMASSMSHINAILDGFTIRDMAGTSTGVGRGITMANGTVRNCIIRDGTGDNINGKGISMSAGLVSNCIITANNIGTGGGDGAGIYASGGAVVNCEISGNIGGARSGAGIYMAGATLVRGCLLKNNAAATAGGIYLASGGVVESCTIASNRATAAGGGAGIFRVSGTAGVITNCVVWSNVAPASVYSNIYSTTTSGVAYVCTTSPTIAGTGCISTDPQFASPVSYALMESSPCIGTGINHAWMTTAFDLAGNPRITGSVVDMGAYEYVAGGVGPVAVPPPRYFYRPNLIMRPNQAIKNQESAQ